MGRAVIALGGNALGDTPASQLDSAQRAASAIADLVENGEQVVVTHGNGPQVGMINLAFSAAQEAGAVKSDMPFPECAAMSEGYIGWHLQNSLERELEQRGIKKTVVTLITEVEVSADDPAFAAPTKPIGAFYTKERAEQLAESRGWTVREDAGRGYRRVVASPQPVGVVQLEAVRALVDAGCVVIAAGGGGVPVVRDGGLAGVSAVIDKDLASEKLAELLRADTLMILTAVNSVMIDYGKPTELPMPRLTVSKAEEYCAAGQFSPGSMLPKVRAAVSFAKTGGRAVIASLDNAAAAFRGESGTSVVL